jgi:predicted short-subunit dehydrogenase-like oxidoreductase (DUF2520 family)
MKVGIVGSGNVAAVLGTIIKRAGHGIVELLSRNEERGKKLATSLGASWRRVPPEVDGEADIYIIAVNDSALTSGDLPKFRNTIVAHTAGSVSMEVLKDISNKYGVIYPLQSLHLASATIPPIPFLIDGSDQEVTNCIQRLAQSISKNVTMAPDEVRLKYHLSAVVVNNFTNHLFAQAEKYCNAEGIDFKNLLPLIKETTDRVRTASPSSMQTGPAIRHDTVTIEKHLHLLEDNPHLMKLYQFMTSAIQGQ